MQFSGIHGQAELARDSVDIGLRGEGFGHGLDPGAMRPV
jgi:hypothetical protein